jgi:2'-5' RNA ligase
VDPISGDRFRAFIAVDLSGLLQLDPLFDAIRGVEGKIKTVEPENVHLTLKFLGDTPVSRITDIVDVMRASVEGAGPFVLEFRGVGAFPKRDRPRVIWVGVEGDEGVRTMGDIANRIDLGVSKLGYKREKRRFSPHLTVGRVKFVRDKRGLMQLYSDHEGVDFGNVTVSSIKLKKSVLGPRGPTYSTVEDVELKG